MRKLTKRTTAIVAASAVAIGGGAAWAATSWLNGNGTASASAATIKPVVATATVTGSLYPNVSRNASVSAENSNEYGVNVTTADITRITVTPADPSTKVAASTDEACTDANAALSLNPVYKTIPAGGIPTTAPATWANFVHMGANASAACAGATFKIDFKLNGNAA